MRLLLVGPPGSGKGTQAKLLSERWQLAHISTGDLLRDAIREKTLAGQLAKPYVDRGELVPDSIVNQMVAERFQGPHRPKRFIMDGYPRNRSQAVVFDQLLASLDLSLDAVIELQVEDETIVRRLSGRRICPVCKTTYQLLASPPRSDNVCDNDQTPLILREDDREETVRHRLLVYHQTSADLLNYYRKQDKLFQVQAGAEIEKVYADLDRVLQSLVGSPYHGQNGPAGAIPK
jgi:adenylate kinase